MKKIISILFATFLTANLLSCNSKTKECSHIDSNKDHLCDICEIEMGEHKDLDGDNKCDYCGELLPIIIESEWSGDAKQLMTKKLSVALPCLGETWSEPELVDENIVSYSEVGDLEQLKTVFVNDGYKIQNSSNNLPGFTAKKEICDEGCVVAEIADFSEQNKGFMLTAYLDFATWPTSLIKQYTNNAEGAVPSPEAESFSIEFVEQALYISCFGKNIENYFSILSSSFYIDKTVKDFGKPYLNYSTYFAENFDHTIQLVFMEYDNYFVVMPTYASPIAQKDSWTESESDLMNEILGETLPFFNAEFVFSEGELNRCKSLTSYSLRIGAFEMAAKVFSDDDSWTEEYDSDSLLYTFTKTSSVDSEKIIIVTICHDFGQCYLNAYCVDPALRNWPAQKISDYISDHTAETVPQWNGILFVVSYYVETYNALIIDCAGDAKDYVNILLEADWLVFDSTTEYGYYECVSPARSLTIAILPQHGYFQMQLLVN